MFDHWPILTFVAETLAMNAAGIDKSGIDLRFTVDGSTRNANEISGDSGRKTLRERLGAAWPERRQKDNVTTDMAAMFQNLYKEWEHQHKPATTLFVFTDGKWTRKDTTALHESILRFAKQDRRSTGKRHFSIQFIRFGDDEVDKQQLQWLDDGLCSSRDLRDIIDHCSWRATVDKIFKGSIEGFHDEKDDEEFPIIYDYKKLADKFDRFNKGEEGCEDRGKNTGLLSPSSASTLHRSPSQLSGHSSVFPATKGDTIPSETPRRHSKRFSRSSFFSQ